MVAAGSLKLAIEATEVFHQDAECAVVAYINVQSIDTIGGARLFLVLKEVDDSYNIISNLIHL